MKEELIDLIKISWILSKYNENNWPDDTWYSISDTLDLNLFRTEKGIYANLYPVIDGNTRTDNWENL